MSYMPSEAMIPVFASTKLMLHQRDYWIISLPVTEQEKALECFKSLKPFSSVTVDYKEVSLILATGDWEKMRSEFKEYQKEGPYRAITFDIVLDLNLVGFLSAVSAVLAGAGISIYALSTYLRDHILVKAIDAENTMELLENLIQRCREA
jgi:hypothetical protein